MFPEKVRHELDFVTDHDSLLFYDTSYSTHYCVTNYLLENVVIEYRRMVLTDIQRIKIWTNIERILKTTMLEYSEVYKYLPQKISYINLQLVTKMLLIHQIV